MIDAAIISEIRDDVNGSCGEAKREKILYWAGLLGKSEKSIYRYLGGNGRKERDDKGKIKIDITEEQMELVAALLMESWTKKYDKPIMPAWGAIQLAERMGIIPEGVLLPPTFNRWMKDREISKKRLAERTPHQRMRSRHPNEMHQYDVSVCAQWYLRDDGSVGHQMRDLEVYKNKAGKGPVLKRHVLVDHFSGAFFVQYAESEDTAASLEFLFDAWGRKDVGGQTRLAKGEPVSDPGFVFWGVPERLYTDNGSVIRSAIGKQVCGRLGIDLGAHLPGVPRAKGSVETMMWGWETAFETQLRRFPARSLTEMNERAFEFALWYNSHRKHTRHGQTRFEAWALIKPAELRELPEDRDVLRSLAMRANVERGIGYDGYIQYDGNLYMVPDQRLWGKKCLVGPDVFGEGTKGTSGTKGIDIVVDCEGKKFKLAALKKDDMGYTAKDGYWGDYKAPRATATEKGVKRIAEVGAGIETPLSALKPLPVSQGPGRDIAGKEIELEEIPAARVWGRVAAKAEIGERLGYDPISWQMEIINLRLGDQQEIREELIEGILGEITRDKIVVGM